MSTGLTFINGIYGGSAKKLYCGSGMHASPMIYGKPPKKWPKIVIVVLIIIVLVLLVWQFALGGLPFFKSSSNEETNTKQVAAITALKNYMNDMDNGATATIVVSGVGDCTLGTDENFDMESSFENKYKQVGNPSYFFSNVLAYLRNDNLTICNFEGTLSSRGSREDKEFAFRGPAKYSEILTAGSVEAANLANNHSFDYGKESYEDTKKALTKANITNFGYDRVNTFTVNDIKVGLFGVSCLDDYDGATDLMKQDIAALKEENCNLIIGSFHWGVEGTHTIESDQTKIAHAAIDEGCDLVLGTHPHVLQAVEKYNNRYICYSLGNFCFGGNDNPQEYETMIFQQAFVFRNGELVVDDETLSNIDIIPCSVSSSSKTNNYQPTPLKGKKARALVKVLNTDAKKLKDEGVRFANSLNDDGTVSISGSSASAVNPVGSTG